MPHKNQSGLKRPFDMFDLTGKQAIVTGASEGLGKRFALTLARAGAHVIAAARNENKLKSLVDQLREEGLSCDYFCLDMRDRAAITDVVGKIENKRALDIIVNNAGIAIVKSPDRYTNDDWDSVYETNLRGPWALSQAVIKHRISDSKPCSIINISSVLGIRPLGHLPAYAAAKAGLINLGRDLTVDLAGKKIRVNSIAPGYYETEMNREWLKTDAGLKLLESIPAGRFGQPQDLDGALLFLASDASLFMHGAVLTVDGGHSAGL